MQLKDFMDSIWTATEIDGNTVIDRRVRFGSAPDLEFTVQTAEGIQFVSAKDLFENVSKTS